jgi:hypothetical protein
MAGRLRGFSLVGALSGLVAASCGGATVNAPGPVAPGRGLGGHWEVLHEESFEGADLGSREWSEAPVVDDDPFADDGPYFRKKGVVAPRTFRSSRAFGAEGWLTVESSSRSPEVAPRELAQVVPDPARSGNHALRVRSVAHTDATIVRSTHALPVNYRVSLRVGYASFGDGKPGLNGYHGGETAEPWDSSSAVEQNGFYWLTVLDTPPAPHNNTWIHHHRKVVVDSDNHYPAWMEIWDGHAFRESGEHPVMMFAIDGRTPGGNERIGKPFLSYSGGAWQPSGEVRAVDSYKSDTWYAVSVERRGSLFTLSVEGDLVHGGKRRYSATLDAAARCVFHYNRPGEPAPACEDASYWPELGPGFPHWPAGKGWGDWLMFGEPHQNYYEGEVLYDDVRLEIWRE